MDTITKRALRAMKSAARAGVDPRNSLDTIASKYARAWNDSQRRQSEYTANRLLSHGNG